MFKRFRKFIPLCVVLILTACGADEDQTVSTPPSEPTAAALQDNFAGWLQSYPEDTASVFTPVHTWMERIHLHAALEIVQNQLHSQPIVAVLDSGVAIEHEALAGRIVKTEGYSSHCPGQHHGCNTASYTFGDKDWGHGQIFPVGISSAGDSCSHAPRHLQDSCHHGTHVSGIVAGLLADSDIFGVCPNCRILPVRIVNDAGNITDEAIYAALGYLDELLQEGLPIRIINASFGKYQRSEKVIAALAQLMKRYDLLMVAAAGNENSWQPAFPASLPNVISVVNVNSGNLQKDGRSDYGSTVDIAAPVGSCQSFNHGYGIVSAVPGADDSLCLNGTSMAAPVVSGVAGLLWTVAPKLSAAQVKARILQSADRDRLYAANPTFTFQKDGHRYDLLGTGLLQADGALKAGNAKADTQARVDTSCAVIAGPGNAGLSFWLFLLPLFLPFFSARAHADPKWDASISQELGQVNNQEVKQQAAGLTITRIPNGYGSFVGRVGLTLPLDIPSWSLRTRLDFINRSESYGNSWKSFSDHSDYNHFPLALHRSERTLRANQTVTRSLSEEWAFSLEGEYQDIAMGSRLGQDQTTLDSVPTASGHAYLLRPAVNVQLTSVDQVQGYALRLKSLDDKMGLDSFKTDQTPGKNLGVIYGHRFQESGWHLQAHLFQNTFILNDPFKDFTRRGLTLTAEQGFWQGKITGSAHLSAWEDQYRLPLLGLGSCSEIPEQSDGLNLVRCRHRDQRISFGASLDYALSEVTRIGWVYEYERNQNQQSRLAEFDSQMMLFQVTFYQPRIFALGRENLRIFSRLQDNFSR